MGILEFLNSWLRNFRILGLEFLDFLGVELFTCCNIQPDINAQKIGLMPDGVHPNQKGYFDFIAPKIAEALKSI